jgi:hypothetical protein
MIIGEMGMVKKMQYNLLLLIALAALILVLVNIGLFYSNQGMSDTVAGRQQYLQQSDQLQQIYRPMINSLIELSTKNNDNQIRDLLASQGITYDQKSVASK